jgi:hypothetical protein
VVIGRTNKPREQLEMKCIYQIHLRDLGFDTKLVQLLLSTPTAIPEKAIKDDDKLSKSKRIPFVFDEGDGGRRQAQRFHVARRFANILTEATSGDGT